jgi:AcrR family transcriptional regulator
VAGRAKPLLSPRKTPKQARSSGLVSAILEAALRVLEQEGAQRFTTARVAEKAGISVGSLYQYFPNKAAILFQLQSEEWQRTAQQWQAILEDTDRSPPERLRTLVHVFLRSECDEAAVRGALNDAAPLLRDGPERCRTGATDESAMEAFIREVLPEASDASRRLAADLVETTLTEVGEQFSGEPRTDVEIQAYAGAMADMFEAYLHRLRGGQCSGENAGGTVVPGH